MRLHRKQISLTGNQVPITNDLLNDYFSIQCKALPPLNAPNRPSLSEINRLFSFLKQDLNTTTYGIACDLLTKYTSAILDRLGIKHELIVAFSKDGIHPFFGLDGSSKSHVHAAIQISISAMSLI